MSKPTDASFTRPGARSFGRDLTNSTSGVCEIDQRDAGDPQRLGEYAREIFDYLLSVEGKKSASPEYMSTQRDINEKMRAILIDWLTEVHLKFKLLPETLFLTANLIDRYLERAQVERNRLQLVGVAAMLVACKYEEIYTPEVRDFVFITDRAYTQEEILAMERQILAELGYEVTAPSAYRFLERFGNLAGLDEQSQLLSQYLCELSLVEYKMLRYPPSLIAASSIYLTLKIGRRDIVWPAVLIEHSRYKDIALRQCAKDLCILLQGVEKCTLQAVRKKFSLPKYGEVAKIQIFVAVTPTPRSLAS
jgi:cyclin B